MSSPLPTIETMISSTPLAERLCAWEARFGGLILLEESQPTRGLRSKNQPQGVGITVIHQRDARL